VRFPKRSSSLPKEVRLRAAIPQGDRILAWASGPDDAWLLGTRHTLIALSGDGLVHIAWGEVERADWNRDANVLRVVEVGEYGGSRPVHEFAIDEPGDLLAHLRERVTSTIVIERRAVVEDKRGVNVIARRSTRDSSLRWVYEFDAGVDPADPGVQRAAEQALFAAAAEIGVDLG
jgi:hypothetical protein